MILSFENSCEKTNEKSIEQFETRLRAKLPKDYKEFLLEHNGGRPTPRKFITVDRKNISRVKMFLPLGLSYPDNLEEVYDVFALGNLIPSSLLPIAYDPINNLICVSLKEDDFGSVYYWNQDEETEGHKPSYKWMKLVSKDFLSFLKSLSE